MTATGQPTQRHQDAATSTTADRGAGASTAVVIPSLGAPTLGSCLEAVAELNPQPHTVLVVLSGGAPVPPRPIDIRVVESRPRLGFSAAVNLAFTELDGKVDRIAVLNDDALPPSDWLTVLGGTLDDDPALAAVQGTIADGGGAVVDGRGIEFDRWGLPVQVDRGRRLDADPDGPHAVLAVSGTAALFRLEALRRAAVDPGPVFDPRFGSYHEDLDLGLRLHRLGWTAAWTGGAASRHLGSSSGRQLRWRHPWWLLANRWRALAGNLSASALIRAMPRLIRGELRAIHTLSRSNPRATPVAAAVLLSLPAVVVSGWRRKTAGPRLAEIPGP
jgi:GT2 family glycosyltransferase